MLRHHVQHVHQGVHDARQPLHERVPHTSAVHDGAVCSRRSEVAPNFGGVHGPQHAARCLHGGRVVRAVGATAQRRRHDCSHGGQHVRVCGQDVLPSGVGHNKQHRTEQVRRNGVVRRRHVRYERLAQHSPQKPARQPLAVGRQRRHSGRRSVKAGSQHRRVHGTVVAVAVHVDIHVSAAGVLANLCASLQPRSGALAARRHVVGVAGQAPQQRRSGAGDGWRRALRRSGADQHWPRGAAQSVGAQHGRFAQASRRADQLQQRVPSVWRCVGCECSPHRRCHSSRGRCSCRDGCAGVRGSCNGARGRPR